MSMSCYNVRAHGECPVSLAATLMRWLQRPKWSSEHGIHTEFSPMRAWPIDRCSDKDAGRSQRATPDPL